MQTPIASPFRFFPIKDYSQVTSKWIDPNQEEYDRPMMDAAIQKRYLEQLWKRLYGRASPWDEDYVQDILQEDIGVCQEKALLRFSNHDKSKQDKWYGMNFRPYASTWIKNIKENIPFIKNAHGNTIRKSGEPYYTHPMGVAKIVLEATNNADTILAALLHDVVEDTIVTLEQIELLYGMEVAYIVDMVTHYNPYGYRWKLDHSDSQIILNQCKDIRVVQIKLADRLHNLRTISIRKLADQKRIAKDTMNFYIPWSKKNNVLTWLSEMEHICEQVLHVNPA